MKIGYVYIVSNNNRTTFYIGVTNDIKRRTMEHKAGVGAKFTSKYNLTDLLFYEEFNNIKTAIAQEKRLKNWHREWKINLIKSINPNMEDIAKDWFTKEQIEERKRDSETSLE